MDKVKILIVDDYPENIEALSQLIEGPDVEIFSATNAEGALELIVKHEFGLALLDVQMPNTTGFELAKMIRGVKRFKSLPIIFVTAHAEDSSVVFESYSTGAVDLLFKPLNPNMVRAKVQMFVELSLQRALLQSHVEELEKLRVEADAANLAKSQFLANMSHEIRTPLAAVMGFSDLLTNRGATDKERDDYAAAVKRNGHLLMRLVDDILDLTKIEANKLELEHTSFDLTEVLRDVDSTMSFRAQENGVRLIFKSPEKLESAFISDPVRIKQTLLNLIGNAVKFTPKGNVEVNVQLDPDPQNDKIQQLIVTIADDGVGLTKEQADRLFKPFSQADASTKRQFGGSGLGLVISRQIARALGGDIRLLVSQPGKGATFEIRVPLQKGKTIKSKPITSPKVGTSGWDNKDETLKGKRILAVDDSADNLMLLTHFLRGSGVELTLAESGLKALAAVEKNEFDLILMDIQMPGMDGHETTVELRRLNFTKPIVALTAHALRSDHDKCRESGCDSVLTKPLSRSKLYDKLQTFLSPNP